MVKRKKGQHFMKGVIAIIAVVVAVTTLGLLMKMTQTETYYVLNQDIPAKAEITPDLLSPVTVSKGGAPKSALSNSVFSGGDNGDGEFVARYDLMKDDILTYSNVMAPGEDINQSIPEGWVTTNFSVQADNAVGGRIQAGSHFDMLVVDGNKSFYPFINVPVLDTTVDLSNASSKDAANTTEATNGMTTQYVVGLPAKYAAKLHEIVANYGNIKLVESPRGNTTETETKANEKEYKDINGSDAIDVGHEEQLALEAESAKRDEDAKKADENNNADANNADGQDNGGADGSQPPANK